MAAARRRLALVAGGLALALAGCRLDSRLLYFPRAHDEATWRRIAERTGAEPVRIERDGIVLRGWLLRPPGAADRAPVPAVVYFGGNAEDVSWMLGEAARLGGHALLAVPYRGYGASTGAPFEQDLYDDAVALYDALAARPGIDAGRIAVWGRSLGSGVATWVASRRPVSAVVLSAPYDSIAALARRHYPGIAFLLGQPFDSLARAPAVSAPLLAILGLRDTVVPPEHGERLAAAWGGLVRVLRLPQAGHDDLQAFPEHWREVSAFLGAAAARRGGPEREGRR
jgi:dipeptidyl aminopeptidase/acylaminoacyl peptidase